MGEPLAPDCPPPSTVAPALPSIGVPPPPAAAVPPPPPAIPTPSVVRPAPPVPDGDDLEPHARRVKKIAGKMILISGDATMGFNASRLAVEVETVGRATRPTPYGPTAASRLTLVATSFKASAWARTGALVGRRCSR